MPQNAFHKPWEQKDKVYAQSAKRLDFIAAKIKQGKQGTFYTNIPLEIMMRPLHGVVQRACRKDFSKRTGLPDGTPMDELIYVLDKSFAANERCTGCGTCAEVCPAGNIKLEDGRPVWLGHCENCLACFNWCPKKAITGGVSQGYYYRHPEIGISEMKGNII
jgi:ferredoxin